MISNFNKSNKFPSILKWHQSQLSHTLNAHGLSYIKYRPWVLPGEWNNNYSILLAALNACSPISYHDLSSFMCRAVLNMIWRTSWYADLIEIITTHVILLLWKSDEMDWGLTHGYCFKNFGHKGTANYYRQPEPNVITVDVNWIVQSLSLLVPCLHSL